MDNLLKAVLEEAKKAGAEVKVVQVGEEKKVSEKEAERLEHLLKLDVVVLRTKIIIDGKTDNFALEVSGGLGEGGSALLQEGFDISCERIKEIFMPCVEALNKCSFELNNEVQRSICNQNSKEEKQCQ